jgi:alpha-beta hydrolase superfamily lysophospholipase
MAVINAAREAGGQLRAAGAQIRQSSTNLRNAGATLTVLAPHPRRTPWSADFYETPSARKLKHYEPGEIIHCEPMRAFLLPGVRLKAMAHRVLYRSTGAIGEPTAVSGTVLVPEGIRGDIAPPVVAYAPGTHGIGDAAAPSRLLASGHDWEATPVAHILGRGYAVAITDYQGLGTAGDHAFMVGQALGRNVLDVLRAAYQVAPGELSQEAPVGVIGYSEGGYAAAWAAQLQEQYAPELQIAGVAAGAAAADMRIAVSTLDGHFGSFFLAYGAIGYAAAYPELELDEFLTEKGAHTVAMMRQSNLFQAMLRGPRFMKTGELTEPNVLELPAWQKRLGENTLGAEAPIAPVLLHHGWHDQIVSPAQSRELLAVWRELGADVRLRYTRAGVDHLTGGLAGAPLALGWLSSKIERAPAALASGRAVSIPAAVHAV